MLNLAAHRKDLTVALVAAFVLLLQAFSSAWMTGAMAAGAMPFDAWGNPLCITSSDHGTSPDDGAVKLPDCCVIGCGMSATVLAEPAGMAVLNAALAGSEPLPLASNSSPRTSEEHDPGSPRAPPAMA